MICFWFGFIRGIECICKSQQNHHNHLQHFSRSDSIWKSPMAITAHSFSTIWKKSFGKLNITFYAMKTCNSGENFFFKNHAHAHAIIKSCCFFFMSILIPFFSYSICIVQQLFKYSTESECVFNCRGSARYCNHFIFFVKWEYDKAVCSSQNSLHVLRKVH